MLRIFALLISIAFTINSDAQNLGFDIDYENGRIQNTYLVENNYVFKIHSSGNINAIYIFENESEAKDFVLDPRTQFLPRKRLSLGGGVTIYLNAFESIEYCKNYSTYSRAGIVGEICSIDNLDIEYNLKIGNNSNIGIVGKLKSIGPYTIKYHTNYSSNVAAGIMGKVESIGNTKFTYWGKYSSSDTGNYTGHLKQIDNISIKYHENYSGNKGFTGKIKSIGNINFNYYKNYSTNNSMGVVGKFKSREGSDARLIIL